jgi:hypothetical protein
VGFYQFEKNNNKQQKITNKGTFFLFLNLDFPFFVCLYDDRQKQGLDKFVCFIPSFSLL